MGLAVLSASTAVTVLAPPLLYADSGERPALHWARAAGFPVVAAGKGTKYLPAYHASTPDTVWAHYGLSHEDAQRGGMNAQMFNSFLDGTKSAI